MNKIDKEPVSIEDHPKVKRVLDFGVAVIKENNPGWKPVAVSQADFGNFPKWTPGPLADLSTGSAENVQDDQN